MKPRRISGRCVKCSTYRVSLHRDHIKPKFQGGTDDEFNIQFLCANCHEDKSREERVGWRATPEMRIKYSEGQRRRYRDPSECQKNREIQKNIWKDPATRERLLAVIRARKSPSEAMKAIWSDPERRRQMSETQKKNYADPSIRAQIARRQKIYYADPMNRRKHSEAIKKGKRKAMLLRWNGGGDESYPDKIFAKEIEVEKAMS